jgi:hypothetical protein
MISQSRKTRLEKKEMELGAVGHAGEEVRGVEVEEEGSEGAGEEVVAFEDWVRKFSSVGELDKDFRSGVVKKAKKHAQIS